MVENDEYELVSSKEIAYLKEEVEKLKKGMPLLIEKDATTLLEAMNKLTKSIVNFTQILESAKDEIVKDYYEHSLTKRIGNIEQQNEKLARGMIAISDMIKNISEKKEISQFSVDTTQLSTSSPTNQPLTTQPIQPPQPTIPKLNINEEEIPPPPL